MKARLGKSRVDLLAAVLAGAWRQSSSPPQSSAKELAGIASLLLRSGTAALGWWKIRCSKLRTSPAALQLQQAYRLHTFRAALHEWQIGRVFTLLRRAGVEPLLVKGWAIARLYPEPGLRPYGDIDLCVRTEEYPAAQAALNSTEGRKCDIDLHQGFTQLDDRSLDDVYRHSRLVKLGEVDVRVLSHEDHLRVLSVHLLRHGAWRPLWLCDIAVAVEFRPASFDWDYCLRGNRRRADWVACTVGLAHQILGAEVDDTPLSARAKNLPNWLIPTVLKQWETPYAINQAPMRHKAPMVTYLCHPAGVLKDIRNRWPNPIEATISVNGPFNELPRLPFQIGNWISRTANLVLQLPAQLTERRRDL